MPETDEGERQRQVNETLAAMEAAYRQVAAELDALRPAEAFALFTALRDGFERLRRRSAKDRAKAVARMHVRWDVPMSELAKELGLSKPRIQQLLREARKRNNG